MEENAMSNEQEREEREKFLDSLIEQNERIIQDLKKSSVKSRENNKKILERMDKRQENIDRQFAEIRRLRIENNRLLDILCDRHNSSDQ